VVVLELWQISAQPSMLEQMRYWPPVCFTLEFTV
jgi:hypothetical protein